MPFHNKRRHFLWLQEIYRKKRKLMLLLFCRAFLNINWGTKNCHAFALFQAQKRINSTVGYSKVNSHCTFYANAPLKLLVSSLKNFNLTKTFEEMKMFFLKFQKLQNYCQNIEVVETKIIHKCIYFTRVLFLKTFCHELSNVRKMSSRFHLLKE